MSIDPESKKALRDEITRINEEINDWQLRKELVNKKKDSIQKHLVHCQTQILKLKDRKQILQDDING